MDIWNFEHIEVWNFEILENWNGVLFFVLKCWTLKQMKNTQEIYSVFKQVKKHEPQPALPNALVDPTVSVQNAKMDLWIE